MSDVIKDIPILIDVRCKAKTSLIISLLYSDTTKNKNINLKIGKKYEITYLKNGKLRTVLGVLKGINKIHNDEINYEPHNYRTDYKIIIDSSEDNMAKVYAINTNHIRAIELYNPYLHEPSDIENAQMHNATTIGTIYNFILSEDSVINTDTGSITSGKIISGELSDTAVTTGGITYGKNEHDIDITVLGGTIKGGRIISGEIIQGRIMDDSIVNACIVDSTVQGKSTGGEIVDITLQNSIVFGGTLSGDKMVTYSGYTMDGVTYGGTTYNAILEGGTAKGLYNGNIIYIEDGTTNNGISSNTVIVGGTVIGGNTIGRITYNAKVVGGTGTAGITLNGTTTGGTAYLKNSNLEDMNIFNPVEVFKISQPVQKQLELNTELNGVCSNITSTNLRI